MIDRTVPTIKAIETRYNGYRFRSRLEARWAVFFDALGVAYRYEPEGFDLSHLVVPDYGFTDGGAPGEDMEATFRSWRDACAGSPALYLPDFYISSLDCWIEIKGYEPSVREEALASMLAWETNKDVFVFYGDITIPNTNSTAFNELAGTPSHKHCAGYGWDSPYHWCECSTCHGVGIEFDARSDRLDCKQCYSCVLRVGAIGTWREENITRCFAHGSEPNPCGCPRSGGNNDKGYNGDSPRLVAAYTAARSARFEHGESGPAR